MNNNNPYNNGDIDVKELFLLVWSYKIFITILISVSVLLALYIESNSKKVYTASALFAYETNRNNENINIGSVTNGIPGLSGLVDLGSAENDDLIERVMSRLFIEKLDTKLGLRVDDYYNTYNDKYSDPIWKSIIKKLIGFTNGANDIEELIWNTTINNFINSVDIQITTASNIRIIVNHNDPERAAKIANTIMNTIISDLDEKTKNFQDDRLNYLSEILSEALYDLETIQSKLKNFIIEFSADPLTDFIQASFKLELLKEEFNQAEELHKAVLAMSKLYTLNKISNAEYLLLKKEHPIIDKVEFRRIFGQNEVISAWTWPEENNVNQVLKTLTDRNSRLRSSVNSALVNAEKLAENVNKFNDLERQRANAEATYTVILEQVKGSAFMYGNNKQNSEVYENAKPPVRPLRNTKMTVIVGGIIGLFLGLLLSISVAYWKGIYYSISSLSFVQKINYLKKFKPFKKVSNKNLKKLNLKLSDRSVIELRELTLAIKQNNNQFIMISSFTRKFKARSMSQILGVGMQSDGGRIAYIDFSKRLGLNDDNPRQHFNDNFLLLEKFENLYILEPNEVKNIMSFTTRQGARNHLMELKSDFDNIILSVEAKDAISLARFLNFKDVFHIAISQKNKTKRKVLESINDIIPFGAFLHD